MEESRPLRLCAPDGCEHRHSHLLPRDIWNLEVHPSIQTPSPQRNTYNFTYQRLAAYRRPGFPFRKRYVVRKFPANNHVRSDFRKELLVHSGQEAGQAGCGPCQRSQTIRQPESCMYNVRRTKCEITRPENYRSSSSPVKPTHSPAVNDPPQARRQSNPP